MCSFVLVAIATFVTSFGLIHLKASFECPYIYLNSQFWACLMKFKMEFLPLGKFNLGDGSKCDFGRICG
jgi:hypothetical protein